MMRPPSFGADGTYTGGYSYTPYGELRSATSNATITANSIRYAAGYWDSSVSLYRFGARYYDPAIGRFTQHDPSGQEANPYAYGKGNPVGVLDPSGLSGLSTGLSIASTVVGVAGLAATFTGVGAAAAPFLGAASSALNVALVATSGASGGAIATSAILGAASFGIGGALRSSLKGVNTLAS
jgi:RHS repeat-associated protein